MWLKESSRLTNLYQMTRITKEIYFASDYNARYGYDKQHNKPIIRLYKDSVATEFDTLYFTTEEQRDNFFDMIIKKIQEPNSIIEYDYLEYNKD